MIKEETEAARRVLRMVTEGKICAADGTDIAVQADSVCVHGDNPEALLFVRKIREMLTGAGVEISC